MLYGLFMYISRALPPFAVLENVAHFASPLKPWKANLLAELKSLGYTIIDLYAQASQILPQQKLR